MVRTVAVEPKRWLMDHDSDHILEAPPTPNVWYEVFHAEDVRLIWCAILQTNDETDVKSLGIRWTIDGNVYQFADPVAENTYQWVYRNFFPSTAGTAGLGIIGTEIISGTYYVDKRGLDFKVEVRQTSPVGGNQTLQCWCVRETLEDT